MQMIQENPNPGGDYPPIQTMDAQAVPEGCIMISETVDTSVYYRCSGFVTLSLLDGVVVGMSPNLEAWEAWRASLPPEPDPMEDLRTAKLEELSAACGEAIAAGCDVTLSAVSGHISLTAEDQINLSTAVTAVSQGAEGYPYHLDGEMCDIFSAEDILAMAEAATNHKLYHTTYYNHLAAWVRGAETAAELSAITYGVALPEDLGLHMAAILDMARGNIDAA